MPTPSSPTLARALATFAHHGGTLRTKDAIAAGIHPRTLYALRDSGDLEQVSRGVFRLAGIQCSIDPDLLAVAARVPKGVLCLTSALVVHGLTTQIPREVDLALPAGGWTPRIEHPPVRVFRFNRASLETGVEERRIDGIVLRLFDAEKTIADCFKFRNRIGMDIALEAIRMYRSRSPQRLDELMRYAEIDRVAAVMRPYLEATLS